MDKLVMNAVKQNTLETIKALVEKDEDFAIEIVDALLDKVWQKEEMITVIEEAFTPYETEENEEDMNDNDDYIRREYERSVI